MSCPNSLNLSVMRVNNMLLHLQVVSVGFINGGNTFNVIPETVTFGGTFRSMTDEGLSYLMKRIREVLQTHCFQFPMSIS